MYASSSVDRIQFFSSKPADVTNFNWLFNRANPAHLPKWFGDFIDLIDRRSINAPDKITFFEQPYLIKQLEKSSRAIRYSLRILEKLGVVITKRDRQNRHAINLSFFEPLEAPARAAPAKPPAEPPRAAPAAKLWKKVADQVAGEKPAYKDEGYIREEIIIQTATPATDDDKELTSIISTFEAITGARYHPGRDGATADMLRGQFDIATIIMGVLLSALRLAMARPGAQIHSLAYCQSTITEISKSKIKDGNSYLHYLKRKARDILGIELR